MECRVFIPTIHVLHLKGIPTDSLKCPFYAIRFPLILNNPAVLKIRLSTSVSVNGDILLYGCNMAAGQTGVDFIGRLSQATGADIAASNNTG